MWRRESFFIALSIWHDMFSDADVTRLVNCFIIAHGAVHFYLLMKSIPFLMLLCSSGMAFSINCASYSIVLGIPRFFSTPFFWKQRKKKCKTFKHHYYNKKFTTRKSNKECYPNTVQKFNLIMQSDFIFKFKLFYNRFW